MNREDFEKRKEEFLTKYQQLCEEFGLRLYAWRKGVRLYVDHIDEPSRLKDHIKELKEPL